MNDREIEEIYHQIIKPNYEKYLKSKGVHLPSLFSKSKTNQFSKNALVLIYLARDYPNTKKVTKKELTSFIRKYYHDANDVQQARHLAAQSGWWIVSGARDNIVFNLKSGEYQIYTLEEPYPSFKKNRRKHISYCNFDEIKQSYHNRCATCGSEEGKPNFHWPATKTILQIGHKDPFIGLKDGNIIPQCQKCNRADKNRWVYDDKGRVINIASSLVINKKTNPEVKKKIYYYLYNQFYGENPNAWY